MFTGIVEAVGFLSAKNQAKGGMQLGITVPSSFKLQERVKIGDSIATNGVCLTATVIHDNTYYADASFETLAKTCFNTYNLGKKVNLELACTPSTHLGGHIVQGHVDGVGEIVERKKEGDAYTIIIKSPQELLPYIAQKGSITVDGASLTVNDITQDLFRLTLIPHTTLNLAFENWQVGAQVNLEVDVMARYVERLLTFRLKDSEGKKDSKITLKTLMENGFI